MRFFRRSMIQQQNSRKCYRFLPLSPVCVRKEGREGAHRLFRRQTRRVRRGVLRRLVCNNLRILLSFKPSLPLRISCNTGHRLSDMRLLRRIAMCHNTCISHRFWKDYRFHILYRAYLLRNYILIYCNILWQDLSSDCRSDCICRYDPVRVG